MRSSVGGDRSGSRAHRDEASWAIDRGGDRQKLLEPLLERDESFVIRSTSQRSVIDRRKLHGSAARIHRDQISGAEGSLLLKVLDGRDRQSHLPQVEAQSLQSTFKRTRTGWSAQLAIATRDFPLFYTR